MCNVNVAVDGVQTTRAELFNASLIVIGDWYQIGDSVIHIKSSGLIFLPSTSE